MLLPLTRKTARVSNTLDLDWPVTANLNGSGNGRIQAGPQTPREVWNPQQVTVSCDTAVSTGTCTASVYVGPQPAQNWLVDASFSGDTGDTTDAVSSYQVRNGEYVWVVWADGPPNGQGFARIRGTKTTPLWVSLTRS